MAAPSKTFKLRMCAPRAKATHSVGRFEVPQSLLPLDLASWPQPIRMARHGYEENAPAPEAAAGTYRYQQQQNDLRKRPFLVDDASRKIKMLGSNEVMNGRYFVFVSDPNAADTFQVIPVREFYRFTTRPDLKEVSLEEAERALASKDKVSHHLGPTRRGGDDETTPESDLKMDGLSVYGYRVQNEELESEIRQGQDEDGEERDFVDKFDDDNPEDRIAVAVSEKAVFSDIDKELRKSLKKVDKKQDAEEESDSADSEDEFARKVEDEIAQQQIRPSAADEDASRGKKRKAEDEPIAPQTKRVKLEPDHLTRDEMLEEVKKLLRARHMTKRDFLDALKQRVKLNLEHNRQLMVEVVKACAETRKENGADVLALKDDLFGK